MKKSLVVLVAILIASLFTSCQKDDEVIMDKSALAEKYKAGLIERGIYAPDDVTVKTLYLSEKAGGLKNGSIIDPTVAMSAPANNIIVWSDGTFESIWAWMIIDNFNNIIDQGMIVYHYSPKYERIGDPQFYMNWENEYCVPVNIVSNVQNAQIKISLTFSTSVGGRLSFDFYTNCENPSRKWLPLLVFDCSWETCSGGQFGGMIKIIPEKNNLVNLTVGGIFLNTYDYLRFETKGIPSSCKVVFNIMDNTGNYVYNTTLNYVGVMVWPEFEMIPLTFSPNYVEIEIVIYSGNRAQSWNKVYKSCYLVSEKNQVRTWGLN